MYNTSIILCFTQEEKEDWESFPEERSGRYPQNLPMMGGRKIGAQSIPTVSPNCYLVQCSSAFVATGLGLRWCGDCEIEGGISLTWVYFVHNGTVVLNDDSGSSETKSSTNGQTSPQGLKGCI